MAIIVREGVGLEVDVADLVGEAMAVGVDVAVLVAEGTALGADVAVSVEEGTGAGDVALVRSSGVGDDVGVAGTPPEAQPTPTAIRIQAASDHVLAHAIGFA